MKEKFTKNEYDYIVSEISNNLNDKWNVSLTSKGNIKISYPNSNEYFVISLYNEKYYIRRYADYLDRCYRICPSHYDKNYWYNCKYFDYDNLTSALNRFIKFVKKNRIFY